MTHQRKPERVGVGIAAMVSAVTIFAVMDTIGKWLGMSGYNALQIVFLRYTFALIPVAIAVWYHGVSSLKTDRPLAHIARGVLMAATLSMFFTGLRDLPLAEAIAIAFTAPLFVTVLSGPVLGEKVGRSRWMAVLVGFIGMLIVVRPGMATFQPQSLYILVSALTFSIGMLHTRRLTRTETNLAIYSYTTISAALFTLFFQPFVWRMPEVAHMPWFFTMGFIGGFSSFLIIVAYRNAPAAVVAPFDYLALLWGALLGWYIWQEKPDAAIWAGAAIIVLSGLYITWRETRRKPGTPMQKSPAG
jgi:drug/metabolite transporter (DMT)-like permease